MVVVVSGEEEIPKRVEEHGESRLSAYDQKYTDAHRKNLAFTSSSDAKHLEVITRRITPLRQPSRYRIALPQQTHSGGGGEFVEDRPACRTRVQTDFLSRGFEVQLGDGGACSSSMISGAAAADDGDHRRRNELVTRRQKALCGADHCDPLPALHTGLSIPW
jgi:hypothetical protein